MSRSTAPRGVEAQPDGRVVLGGSAKNGSPVVFALARPAP
jgi:hypothetical protein